MDLCTGVFRLVSVPLGWLTSLSFRFPYRSMPRGGDSAGAVLVKRDYLPDPARKSKKQKEKALAGADSLDGLVFVPGVFSFCTGTILPPAGIGIDGAAGCSAQWPIQQVTIDLARRASEERGQLEENEEGCLELSKPISQVLSRAGERIPHLQETYPFLWGSREQRQSQSCCPIVVLYRDNRHVFPVFLRRPMSILMFPTAASLPLRHMSWPTPRLCPEDECNFRLIWHVATVLTPRTVIPVISARYFVQCPVGGGSGGVEQA